MADQRQHPSGGGSGGSLMLSALGGAVLGAAALGWWLLSEADRRRRRPEPPLRLNRPASSARFEAVEAAPQGALPKRAPLDSRLQDRVQELNRAIEEVRRQLEQLQPLP